jgi:hypothetical protein
MSTRYTAAAFTDAAVVFHPWFAREGRESGIAQMLSDLVDEFRWEVRQRDALLGFDR